MSRALPPDIELDRFDPHDMAQRGRIGAYVAHSRHDTRDLTAKARQTFLDTFEQQVDPEGTLPESERRRRAEAARRAHMARLAYESVKVRRARKAVSSV